MQLLGAWDTLNDWPRRWAPRRQLPGASEQLYLGAHLGNHRNILDVKRLQAPSLPLSTACVNGAVSRAELRALFSSTHP